MVGAGASRLAGFPLWSELIERMKQEFAPNLDIPQDKSVLERAQLIRDHTENNNRKREYFKFLQRQFGPQENREIYTDFHASLIQLGFRGIVTSNYDGILEHTVMKISNDINHSCQPIDLCLRNRKYMVFEFLRSLSTSTSHNYVLHLHGYYQNPEDIIITQSDYLESYGTTAVNSIGSRHLDTLHRKVIWALLAMTSMVFVGFGMDDPFFMSLFDTVHMDFQLDTEPAHFALISYSTDEEMEEREEKLRRRGVLPVFYHVPSTDTDDKTEHYQRALTSLVKDLAVEVGTPVVSENVNSLSMRMLEL